MKKTIEKKDMKELVRTLDKKHGELESSKEIQKLNKDDLLVSYDFNSSYPSAHLDKNITWPKCETAYPPKKYMIDVICSLFSSGRWSEINSSAVLTLKYHNLENLVFQHIPLKEY